MSISLTTTMSCHVSVHIPVDNKPHVFLATGGSCPCLFEIASNHNSQRGSANPSANHKGAMELKEQLGARLEVCGDSQGLEQRVTLKHEPHQ